MIVHKTLAAKGQGLEFVLSDGTPDRVGDVIEPDGWELENFKQNPVALFGHSSAFPIGTWSDLRIKGGKLLGKLNLAAKGTSARIDELIGLVEQGILRAVSVGFKPIESEPLDPKEPFGGQRYIKQELLETSLVSVPANPAALAIAKELKLSRETIDLAFGKDAAARPPIDLPGKHAAPQPKIERPSAMSKTLTQLITDAQTKLNGLRDTLTDHLAKAGDDGDEASNAITAELNAKIATSRAHLEGLQESEKQLAAQTLERQPGTGEQPRRPLGIAPKKVQPGELVLRTVVAKIVAHARGIPPEVALRERYGSDGKVDEQTRVVFDHLTKSVVVPADTVTTGWAKELVETQIADFMGLLMPASVYPGLSSRGLRLSFGRSGVISIPTRASTPTVAGAFTQQGAPIPVKQAAFSAATLVPKKMAVISTFTREIAEHSTPAIEGLIKDAMREDTSVALDTVLLDATAADVIRPAGIRNGVSVTTATAGGGFAALVGDIKALVGALITGTAGNVRNPVWIMNPIQAIAISLTQNAGGDFPFSTEINGNRLQGYPVIQSSTVPAGMVILVDAADFVSVEGDAPRFDVSDQALLHMETVPAAISAVGSPNTVAAPARSLWQTDSMGVRMIMDVNWALRRTGVVAWTQAVTW